MMKRTFQSNGDSEELPSKSKPSLKNCQFSVDPLSKFVGRFPFYRKPVEIGFFSQSSTRTFKNDNSQLKYYCSPADKNCISFDLNHGYDIFIRRDDSQKEFLNDLLRWILLHKGKFLPANKNVNKDLSFSLLTDFVCWRGLLTRLLCTPYENRDGWCIAVTLFRGTYYMYEFDTMEKIHQRQTANARQQLMTYWGYKFEQYVMAPTPDSQPDTTQPVNNHEGFVTVVRTRLEKHSLVFAGEVDGVDMKMESKAKYIELKTSRIIENYKQENNFKKFKLIKWWAQSFLPGIEKIICGFRDDDGIVRTIKTFKTSEIPEYCKDASPSWDPCVCFNFCNQFLMFVKDVVVNEDPRIAYVFRWDPKSAIRWAEYPPNSEYTFLPAWYYKEGGGDT